ncbi:DUF192 domain-containing protein [Alcaligenaceae bacterium SJ-26]|nr:DUF192 domain-containing protein [Alcaligenaceae bacterium SJ-26]
MVEQAGQLERPWQIRKAWRWHERLCGLLGRKPLRRDEMLWLQPCQAVHTWGMRYRLDLVFLDRDGRILRIDIRVLPGRIRGCRGAYGVLELRGGVLADGPFKDVRIDRIKTAVQHSAQEYHQRRLQHAEDLDRNARSQQQRQQQIHAQEQGGPAQAIQEQRQLVAPAGNPRKEERLQQGNPVPEHQCRGLPEQCR